MEASAEQEGRDEAIETPAVNSNNPTNGDDNTSSEHKFQKAISAWRSIGLTGLISDLDKTAAEIVENQKDALVQRKELAQKTKDYRKLDDQAKLAEWKVLLKLYQTFIDTLTTHGKTTSTAFLQLYSTIVDAPDPYPLLEASIDSLLVSEDTIPKLKSENDQLQRSISTLTHNLELREKQLEQERSRRQEVEETQQKSSKDAQTSWQTVLDEERHNWEAKEKALEEKLENQERLFNELKASYEVSQRLGPESGASTSTQITASAAELEMVSLDLEGTKLRVAELEGRNKKLIAELAQATSNAPVPSKIEDDPAFMRLQTQNSSLLREVAATKRKRDEELGKLDTEVKTLARSLRRVEQDREELEGKLRNQADYAEVKRDLEVFKAIELSYNANDEDDVDTGGKAPVEGHKKTLMEEMIEAKRKLDHELVGSRTTISEMKQNMANLEEAFSKTKVDLEEAQKLNATLELQIEHLSEEASNVFPMSAKSVSSRYPTSATFARSPRGPMSTTSPRRVSPTSSIISGYDTSHRVSFGDSLQAADAGDEGAGVKSLIQTRLTLVSNQNKKLTAELQKQSDIVSELRSEIAALQKDNLNLYEKTKYAGTYQRSGNTSSSQASSARLGTSIQISSDPPDRYRAAYEASLSPFAQFRGREAARAYKRMSMPERMIYSMTRLVLANRLSRNLFAIYCVALHLLIFMMLYWMQTTDVERHAVHLGQAALSGAAAIGGGVGSSGTGAGSAAAAAAAGAHHGDWHEEGLDAGKPAG